MKNVATKLKLYNTILQAYSDCNDTNGERNLKFIATEPLTAAELTAFIPKCIPDGYNGFDPIISIKALVEYFGDSAEYYVARENSVCIYILPKHNLWFSRGTSFSDIPADELLWCPENKMFRVWWD